MSKGLLIHIISAWVYLLCVVYITQGDDNDMSTRLVIVLGIMFIQLVVAALNDINDNYKKKL